MSLSCGNNPRIRILFEPDELVVVKDMATERLAISMDPRHDEMEPSVTKILLLDDNNPYLLACCPPDLQIFAERMIEYGRNSGRAETNLRMTLSSQLAEPLVEDRLNKGDRALVIAEKLLKQMEFWHAIGQQNDFPDDWAS